MKALAVLRGARQRWFGKSAYSAQRSFCLKAAKEATEQEIR